MNLHIQISPHALLKHLLHVSPERLKLTVIKLRLQTNLILRSLIQALTQLRVNRVNSSVQSATRRVTVRLHRELIVRMLLELALHVLDHARPRPALLKRELHLARVLALKQPIKQ